LIGVDGIGPWQVLEQEAFLSQASRKGLPVIPVLLPQAPESLDIPMFLGRRTIVDLREGLTKEGLDLLQWGITGTRLTPVDDVGASENGDDQNFDVFLCFRDTDRLAVQRVAEALNKDDIRCWPDDWTISSEESWRRLLSRRVQRVQALVVFAAEDIGPWEDDDVESFIWGLIEDGQLVIPVILPSARRQPKFPVYLRRRQNIDLRDPDGIKRLADLLSEHRKDDRGRSND
jgi:hypothetical protein